MHMFYWFWPTFYCKRFYLHFISAWSSSIINTTFLHVILPLDVAERAFSRCVTTNEGNDKFWNEEVHADSRKLTVKFNYEFLEDFQNKQSSGKLSLGEEGPANIDTRYTSNAQIFLSSLAYTDIVMLYPPTVLCPGSRRNSQSTVTHCFWLWVALCL